MEWLVLNSVYKKVTYRKQIARQHSCSLLQKNYGQLGPGTVSADHPKISLFPFLSEELGSRGGV